MFGRTVRENLFLRKDAKFLALFCILSVEMLGLSSQVNEVYCLSDEGFCLFVCLF